MAMANHFHNFHPPVNTTLHIMTHILFASVEAFCFLLHAEFQISMQKL